MFIMYFTSYKMYVSHYILLIAEISLYQLIITIKYE